MTALGGSEVFRLFGTVEVGREKFARDMAAMEKRVGGFSAKLQTGFARVQGAIERNRAAIRGVGMALTGVGGIGIGVGKKLVGAAADMEKYQAEFEVLTGSSEAAKKRLQELTDFAAKTPFDLPGIIDAGKLVEAFGLDLGGVGKTMTTFGDTAAAMGVPIQQVIRNFAKLQAGMFDMAEMAPLGITRDKLKEFGVQFSETGEVLNRDDLFPAAIKLVEGFSGTMDRVSKTTGGALSNLGDSFFQVAAALGASLTPKLKPIIRGITAIADRVIAWAKENPTLAATVVAVGAAITGMAAVLGPLLIALPTLSAAIAVAGAAFAAIAAAAGPIALVIGALVALGIGIYEIVKHWDVIKAATSAAWQAIWNVIGPTVESITGTLSKWGEETKTIFADAWEAVRIVTDKLWEWFGPYVMACLDLVVGDLKAAWAVVRTVSEVAWEAVKLVVGTAWDAIKLIIGSALDLIRGVVRAGLQVLRGDWSGAWQTVKDTVWQVLENIIGFVESLAGRFLEAGRNMLQSLARGIKDATMAPVNAVKGALKKIRDMLPGSDPKEGPLAGLTGMGKGLMETLARGMLESEGDLADAWTTVCNRLRRVWDDTIGDILNRWVRGQGMLEEGLAADVLGQWQPPPWVHTLSNVGTLFLQASAVFAAASGDWRNAIIRLGVSILIQKIMAATQAAAASVMAVSSAAQVGAGAEMLAAGAEQVTASAGMVLAGDTMYAASINMLRAAGAKWFLPFQRGGIVASPTRALIGEMGAEAVVPLEGGLSPQLAQAVLPAVLPAATRPGGLRPILVTIEEGAMSVNLDGATDYQLYRFADRLAEHLGGALRRRLAEGMAG